MKRRTVNQKQERKLKSKTIHGWLHQLNRTQSFVEAILRQQYTG